MDVITLGVWPETQCRNTATLLHSHQEFKVTQEASRASVEPCWFRVRIVSGPSCASRPLTAHVPRCCGDVCVQEVLNMQARPHAHKYRSLLLGFSESLPWSISAHRQSLCCPQMPVAIDIICCRRAQDQPSDVSCNHLCKVIFASTSTSIYVALNRHQESL